MEASPSCTASIHNSYRKGRLSVRMEASLSLLYTVSIHNSYREGRLSVRMEASLFLIQLPYTPANPKRSILVGFGALNKSNELNKRSN